MHFVKTTQTRRFLGELTRSMDVGRALAKLMEDNAIRCGHVRIMGHFERAELLCDGPKGPGTITRVLDRHVQIISCEGIISELSGNFEPVLYTLVTFEGEAGSVTVGGVLQSATVLSCHLLLDAFDDLFIRRAIDPRVKLPTWVQVFTDEDPSSAPPPAPVETTPAPVEEEVFDDDEIIPEAGDKIVHFKFGECLVVKFERENDILQVKQPGKRSLRLGVSVLDFTLLRVLPDGTKVYRASRK